MPDPRICSIPGCGKPVDSWGWCHPHYLRWRRHGDPLAGRSAGTGRGVATRYLNEVVLCHTGDECLIWPFSRNSNGYGQINRSRRPQIVSRLVCERLYGPAPTPTHQAAHSCGKGHEGCVSPKHLRWATPVGNQADRLEHGTHNRGERCGAAKLTDGEVREIRRLKGAMLIREIAEQFGISPGNIGNIFHGRTWAWLK